MICLNSGGNLVRSQVEEREATYLAQLPAQGKETRPLPSFRLLPSRQEAAHHVDCISRSGEAAFRSSHRSRKDALPRHASSVERNRVCTSGHEARGCLPLKKRGPATAATTQCAEKPPRTIIKPDPETGVAPGFTRCRNMRSRRRCSMCPAIHINSRSWLRSSSTHEPSDPPLRVVSRHAKQGKQPFPSSEAVKLSGSKGQEEPSLLPLVTFQNRSVRKKTTGHPGRPIRREARCSKDGAL